MKTRWRRSKIAIGAHTFVIYHNLNRFGLKIKDVIDLMTKDGIQINQESIINSVRNINIPGVIAMSQHEYQTTLKETNKIMRNAK
jgi:hypothetical protein